MEEKFGAASSVFPCCQTVCVMRSCVLMEEIPEQKNICREAGGMWGGTVCFTLGNLIW